MAEIGVLMLPRIEAESVTQKVRSTMRDHILSGDVKPGTRLVETQLAEQLGVSRAPVREALSALESEGLVVSEPNKGTFVAVITEEDLAEIYTVRIALEGLAMRLVARRIDSDGLASLSDIVESMKRAADEGDAERVSAMDLEFHQRIWKLSGHRRLYQILTSMMTQIRVFLALNGRVYEDLLDNCMEHVVLLDMLRSKDADKAEQVMVQHIEEAGKVTTDYLTGIKHAP